VWAEDDCVPYHNVIVCRCSADTGRGVLLQSANATKHAFHIETSAERAKSHRDGENMRKLVITNRLKSLMRRRRAGVDILLQNKLNKKLAKSSM
jgi:hypothetical protein